MSRSSEWWKIWAQSSTRSSSGNEGRLSSAPKLSGGLRNRETKPASCTQHPSEQHFTINLKSFQLSKSLFCFVFNHDWCDFISEFFRIHHDQLLELELGDIWASKFSKNKRFWLLAAYHLIISDKLSKACLAQLYSLQKYTWVLGRQ